MFDLVTVILTVILAIGGVIAKTRKDDEKPLSPPNAIGWMVILLVFGSGIVAVMKIVQDRKESKVKDSKIESLQEMTKTNQKVLQAVGGVVEQLEVLGAI